MEGFEIGVESFLLGIEGHFDVFHFFRVLVSGFLTEGLEFVLSNIIFLLFVLVDGVGHVFQLSDLAPEDRFDFVLFLRKLHKRSFYYSFKFLDDDSSVSVEFALHSSQSAVLEGNELIKMNEVISQGHLVLFVCFVEIFVQHLKVSFLGVELTGVVLGIDFDFVSELFSLGNTHDVSPIG